MKKRGDRRTQECVYNEKGILIGIGKDLCDCLNEQCCGCFFPCVKCRSAKCGPECRQKRKYMYESYRIEGTDIIIRNDYSNAK